MMMRNSKANIAEAVRLIDAFVGCATLCVAIIGLEDHMCLPKYHVAILRHLISSLAFIAAHGEVRELKTRCRFEGLKS